LIFKVAVQPPQLQQKALFRKRNQSDFTIAGPVADAITNALHAALYRPRAIPCRVSRKRRATAVLSGSFFNQPEHAT
jgi:hypothetical protein